MKNEVTAIVVRLVLCGCLALGGFGFNAQSTWATSDNPSTRKSQESIFEDCHSRFDFFHATEIGVLLAALSIYIAPKIRAYELYFTALLRATRRATPIVGVPAVVLSIAAIPLTGMAVGFFVVAPAVGNLVCGKRLSAMYGDGVVSFSYDDPATAAPVEVRCLTSPSPQGDKEALALKAQLEQNFVSEGDVDWQNLKTWRILPETCTHIDHI